MAKKRHRKSSGAGFFVKTALILTFSILALVCLAVCLRPRPAPFPRLEIAGSRISRDEYLRAMYQARNEVLSDHTAAGISLKDWSVETALGDPCQLVTDRTLEILSEYYAVSTLAVDRGYLADAGYEAMLEDMEDINRQRQAALEAGTVITGLPSFTAEDFIAYRASSIRLQFCGDGDNPEYAVTEEEILQRYEADRDNLYCQPDSMDLIFLLTDGADDALEQEFTLLRQKALETGSLAPALEEHPGLSAYYQEISVTPGTYGAYARSLGDVLAWAEDLQAGDISRVFRQEDRLCLIQCTRRTARQYVPLEDARSAVVQSIRESRYDALIAQAMAEMEIRGDLQALYRFTAEQFH